MRADVGGDLERSGESTDVRQEGHGLRTAQSFGQFGKRLRGDADAGHVVPRGRDGVANRVEKGDRIGDLRAIVRSIDRDEARDGDEPLLAHNGAHLVTFSSGTLVVPKD